MTALESWHRHDCPARAASACAVRGRFFDPKRESTPPRCRACLTSREHRVGSLVRQDQAQAHSNSSTRIPVYELPARPRRQLLAMAHIHRIVPLRCRSDTSWRGWRAGRVWACTRPLQSLYAAAELVCRRWVVVTAAVLYYCIIVYTYKILYNRSGFQPLFASSSLQNSELQNTQGRRVKQDLRKMR